MDKQDLALLATTALYAAILDRWQHIWEPDGTWAEVVIGTAICLSAAGRRTRKQPAARWQDYEHAVWRSFFVGGAPIVLWQLGRTIWRQRQVMRYVVNRAAMRANHR